MLSAVGPAVPRTSSARGALLLRRGLVSQVAASFRNHPTLPLSSAVADISAAAATASHRAGWKTSGAAPESNSRSLHWVHTVPAAPGDRVAAVQLLQQPEELLEFVSGSSPVDLPTLHQVLRQLAKASKDPTVAAALQKDERLHQLLQQVRLMLQEADGRLLAQVASALALLRVTNLSTQQLALHIGREAVSRGDCLAPRSLCTLAAALAALQVRNIEVQQFVWREVQQQLQQLCPPDLCLLLEAMRRWGSYSRSNCDLLLQRMSEEIDSFTAADVAAAVDAIASMGLARGFLLRQLSSLAFENLHQFSQQQLLLLMRGLGRLRFLTPANCDALLQHFRIDCSSDQQRRQVQDGEGNAWVDHGWTPHRSAMLLGALALCDVGPAHRASTAVLMQLLQHVEDALEQHAGAAEAAAGGSVAKRTQCLGVAALVEAAYAICYFQLQEKSALLKRLLEEVYAKPASKDRVVLMRAHEIQRAAELEMGSCKVQPPLAWRTAFDEAARQMQDRQETSGLHAEVALALDLLRGGYRLQFQRNTPCGGYRVDFYDQEARICVDVDTVYRHSPCTMKHRHLALQGILPVSIQYWQWRRCRSEEDQQLYLKQRLAPALQQQGRLQMTSFA